MIIRILMIFELNRNYSVLDDCQLVDAFKSGGNVRVWYLTYP